MYLENNSSTSEIFNGSEGLRDLGEVFIDLIDRLPESIFIYSNYKVEYINREAMKLIGVSNKNEVIGRDIRFILRPHEDSLDIITERGMLLRSGEVSLPYIEQQFVKDNGNVYDTEVAASSFILKGKMYVMLTLRDISERKMYERVLRESEEIYRKFIDLLPDGIFITLGDNIVWANQIAAGLLGYSNPVEIIGKNCMKFIPEFLHTTIYKRHIEICRNNCTTNSLKHKVYRKDGTAITVESIASAFRHNGITYVLTVFSDLTYRLKIEELRRKSEEQRRLLEESRNYDKLRTEFFANLSHEVRTPINVLLSSLQLLSKYTNIDDYKNSNFTDIRSHIQMMKQNCNRLLRLFNNLIDITRIDAGFIDLNIKNYDIVYLVEETTLSVAKYIEEKGISLVFDTEIEEKIIAVDPDKLERIILNLLSNSTKFTNPGGSINVNIRDIGNYVSISVKDTGVGIEADKLDMIFDRFVQVDKSFTRRNEGSGIGLSIVKSLVELLGGRIEVKSIVNEGSEFIVYLPINRVDDSEVAFDTLIPSAPNPERAQIEFSDI